LHVISITGNPCLCWYDKVTISKTWTLV